jgi:alkylation response protein AidB-like acyl-CoA dehydrogenase
MERNHTGSQDYGLYFGGRLVEPQSSARLPVFNSTTGQPCGTEANLAKLLAADASWEAANICLRTHSGHGFAAEYDVERKFREARLYQVAPISTNLILAYLAEHRLGLPRSF